MAIETVISPLSKESAKRFRDVCRAAGYTQERLQQASGLLGPPPIDAVSPAMLASLADGVTPFHLLTRLFFLGIPVDKALAVETLSSRFVQDCLDCGITIDDGDVLKPVVLVVPVGESLLASDPQRREFQDDEHFVPTICDAALHLNNVAIRSPANRVLDLCCGFGLHGIAASPFATEVIASDRNPRAEIFTKFNAALNGRENLTQVTGDLFDAVQGDPFDLILANPPFIISPEPITTFRFTPHELDGFVQSMLAEVPQYLVEGGVLQTICEWVELEGQDWQDRLAGWFKNCGCDVWILPANRLLPSTYSRNILEQTVTDENKLAEQVGEWTEYLERKSVQAIQGGFIFMRRRDGENWFDITELTKPIQQNIGNAISQGFRARDLVYHPDGDKALLSSKLAVAPRLRQVETSHWIESGWQIDSISLHTDGGLPVTIGIDEHVQKLIEKFDSQRTVAVCLQLFSDEVGLPAEATLKQGLQMIRSLVKSGVLIVP